METNSAPSTCPLRRYRETVRQSRGECKVIITSWMSAEARALLTDAAYARRMDRRTPSVFLPPSPARPIRPVGSSWTEPLGCARSRAGVPPAPPCHGSAVATGEPVSTREAVADETPASWATSASVGAPGGAGQWLRDGHRALSAHQAASSTPQYPGSGVASFCNAAEILAIGHTSPISVICHRAEPRALGMKTPARCFHARWASGHPPDQARP